jgi:hypothetical protein
MTENPILTGFNDYGLIPTVIAFIIMVVFYINLRNTVNNLKDQVKLIKKEHDEHPIIDAFKQWERTEGVFIFLNNQLKNSRVERID